MRVDDPIRTRIRELVLQRVAERWTSVNSPDGCFGSLVFTLFHRRRIDGIFAVEYDAADRKRLHCQGDAIRAWRYDRDGLLSIDLDDCDPGPALDKGLWLWPIWRFHITSDNREVIINELEGPHYAFLLRYCTDGDNADVRLCCTKQVWQRGISMS